MSRFLLVAMLALVMFISGLLVGGGLSGTLPRIEKVVRQLATKVIGKAGDANTVKRGQEIFLVQCAGCHGRKGGGGKGPDLSVSTLSPRALKTTLRRGIPGTDMPRLIRSPERLAHVTAYLLSIRKQALPVAIAGDPSRGEALFMGKAGCIQCHRVTGEGGRMGPNLARVGAVRSAEYLHDSILEPSRDISERYRTVHIVDADGTVVRGMRLDEDSYSIRMLDTSERLRSFLKNQIGYMGYEPSSLMPSYAQVLSSSEVEDLVAYLVAQKGD